MKSLAWLSYKPGEEILAGIYRRRDFLNAYYFNIGLKGRQGESISEKWQIELHAN